MTNVEANGAATLIHGYVARLGLGMTLIRNQINDPAPISEKNTAFMVNDLREHSFVL
jgi:hypothetical protein